MAAVVETPTMSKTPSTTSATSRAVATLLAAIAAGLAAWSGVVTVSGEASSGQILRASLVLTWAVAGLFLARRGEGLAPKILLGTVVAGAGSLAGSVLDFERAGGDVGAATLDVARAVRAVAVMGVAAIGMHALLAYPADGSRARRWVASIGYAVAAVGAGAIWAERPALPLWPVVGFGAIAALAGGIAVAMRYSHAGAPERRSIKWLGWAVTASAGISVASATLAALVSWPPNVAEIAAASTVVIPIALVLSSFERPAGAIDRLLIATIQLAGLAAVVAGVYVIVVLGLGRVPKQRERTILTLSMIAAGVSALLFIPARERLGRLANRLVYGDRAAPDEVIKTFGSRMTRRLPLEELMLQVAESLRKTLALDQAEIWTGAAGTLERSVSDPESPVARLQLATAEEQVVTRAGVSGPAWTKIWLPALLGPEGEHIRIAPIAHSGELLGLIVVRRGATPFSEREDATLADLSRQVGLALHNARLDSALQASLDELRKRAEELQASRARIVAVANDERRRIERNLHDGAQQHLVALKVKMSLAHQIAQGDPETAKAMMEELSGDVQAALEELRTLAHGIYPPLLADRGLAEALRAAAGRAIVPVIVEATGLQRYAPEVEAAVYFCVLEALQNVAKYAGEGTRATVGVREEAGGLVFEVIDDGAGFDVTRAGVGAGFTNMNDRVGAIGGSLRVESALGRGTKIAGAIPLA